MVQNGIHYRGEGGGRIEVKSADGARGDEQQGFGGGGEGRCVGGIKGEKQRTLDAQHLSTQLPLTPSSPLDVWPLAPGCPFPALCCPLPPFPLPSPLPFRLTCIANGTW